MSSNLNELTAISPIDGRYKSQIKELSNYFSEYAYINYRVEIEIKFLQELSKFKVIRKLNKKELLILDKLAKNFTLKECLRVKTIENKTKHDLKAIEYYIKEKLIKTSLSDVAEYVHFGLTSEDINNIAIRLMLRDATNYELLPALSELNDSLKKKAKEYKSIVIVARTHGQPAVPTTLGKELQVFSYRLEKETEKIKKYKLTGKLNGAVGNYNALSFAYPNINWQRFSKSFLKSFKLEASLITTQINNPEDLIEFFQIVQRINGIILDLNQDLWRYISDGWFVQKNNSGEIGSSTMPQKINPILFENSEGNIIVANSLIHGFVDKLPLSRLQRDLSGSTISRNFGPVFSYCLISWINTTSGLAKIYPNKEEIKKYLEKDWSVLSEALQIYLKKLGVKNAYELVRDLTRGKAVTKQEWINIIEKLPIDITSKKPLKNLNPENYLGVLS